MSIHFLQQFPKVLAVSSTKADGPMGSSKNPGPDGGSFRNSARLLNGFGIYAKERLVRAGQVHGASVRWIHQLPPKEETTGPDGSAAKVRRVADVDGLVTYNPEIVGVNLLYVIRRQLIQAGIHAEHIEVSGECTACPENREKFFSYRRDKREAGNVQIMLSIIGFRGRDRSGSEEPSGSMR